ncbi:MAG: response regulator [Deltaproteobacteria bacterium]|nr:response regulator [Deltaproteobacteria bacterium]
MEQKTPVKVLLLEKDPEITEKILQALGGRPYAATCFSSCMDALEASGETPFSLIISGHNMEEKDPVEVMKDFVMTSPMSSVIMVTDLSDSEVEENAEGYGILGNISRNIPVEKLFTLLNTYEKIQQSLSRK